MNGNTNCVTLIVEGVATEEVYLGRDWTSSVLSNKISLLNSSGRTHCIALANPPFDPPEVTAKQPIHRLLQKLAVDHVEAGGDATKVASVAAEIRNGIPVQVLLVNEADASSRLAHKCAEKNIKHISIGCIDTPVNIVTGGSLNQITIRERIQMRRTALCERWILDDVVHAPETATAVAVVSPKASSLASLVFSSCKRGRKYFRPTTQLRPRMMLTFAHQATDLVCNFYSLLSLAASANFVVCNLSEDAPEAPRYAIQVLQQLRMKSLSGTVSAVVTLGRRGAVVADWYRGGRIHSLTFRPHSNSAIVPTPTGSGDWLLGSMIIFNHTWASRNLLNDPVIASTLRAMHFVCDKLGLARNSYMIDVARV